MGLSFEWDPDKCAINERKHRVSFEEASTVFADPLATTIYDPDHSDEEDRYLTLGLSGENRCLWYPLRIGMRRFASSAPAWQVGANESNMKKPTKRSTSKGMRPEYDFSKGVRGKYAQRYAEGTNIVVLAPDVAKAFPNADAVNAALRGLIEVAGRTVATR
jgi:uncharacterized DUF497 family protein